MKIINYHFNEETLEYFHLRSFEVKEVSKLYLEMKIFIHRDYDVEVEDRMNAVESLVEQVINYK
jgi:hypothetical protein